jgi:hypothetical protein
MGSISTGNVSTGNVSVGSFAGTDQVRTPDKARVEVVDLGTVKVGRFTMEPGWRWSESIKPIVGTDTCQARHVGAVVAGRLAVRHGDGTAVELATGDAYVIEPGHEAWVVGDEAFVGLEFEPVTAEEFARPAT